MLCNQIDIFLKESNKETNFKSSLLRSLVNYFECLKKCVKVNWVSEEEKKLSEDKIWCTENHSNTIPKNKWGGIWDGLQYQTGWGTGGFDIFLEGFSYQPDF